MRRKLIFTAVALHLTLVALGAAQQAPWDELGVFGATVGYYTELSGAANDYGYFGNGVGSQLRPVFEVVDAGGQHEVVGLGLRENRESEIRMNGVVDWFWLKGTDLELQRSLAASWAGKIFARYPGASAVVVKLEYYDLPSMQDYRAGARPGWEPFYQSKFVRREKGRSHE